MPRIRAVIFDYIGTLASPRRYTMDDSIAKLHSALAEAGFNTEKAPFVKAYNEAHEKYRKVRFGELREVTNAVWVSETLCNLGFKVDEQDQKMNAALDVFFQDYIDSLRLRVGAKKLLNQVRKTCKMGLVSNFTYASVVRQSIENLGIGKYFDAVLVSQECGWRKPHRKIFTDALAMLDVKAEAAVFVGDNPDEDVRGALEAGLKTVFVASQFFSLADLKSSGLKPDYAAADLTEIFAKLPDIIACQTKRNKET